MGRDCGGKLWYYTISTGLSKGVGLGQKAKIIGGRGCGDSPMLPPIPTPMMLVIICIPKTPKNEISKALSSRMVRLATNLIIIV